MTTLVTRAQAAEITGRSITTIKRWQQRGILPAIYVDGTPMYDSSKLLPAAQEVFRRWKEYPRGAGSGRGVKGVGTGMSAVERARKKLRDE